MSEHDVAPAPRVRLAVPTLWVLMTLAGAFIGPASSPINLPDIFWTMQAGAWMSSHGRLMDSDPFTSAPPADGPLLNVQWLADLVYHAVEAAGGLDLVIVATALVIALTYGLVLAAAVIASGRLRLSCVSVWLAYVLGASNLSPRPQTLAYPLFAVFVLAVVRAEWRADRRLLWLLPVLTAVWANVHGSFFTGWLLLGCAAAAPLVQRQPDLARARPYALTLAACVLASVITPYGPGSLLYLVRLSNNPIVRDLVTEWAPTSVASPEGVLLFGSFGVVGFLMLYSRVRLNRFELLTLLAFGLLGASSVRAVVWWGLALAPTLARLLGAVAQRDLPAGRERPVVNAAISAGICGLVVLSLPWVKTNVPFLPADKRGVLNAEYAPVGAAEYLRAHDPPPGGKMLNDQAWGGYLDWAAWPRHQPFLDGRIELHPTQVWLDYLDIVFPTTRWRSLLDRYAISYAVLSKADEAELVADLRGDPAWRLDYEDAQAAVFSRSSLAGP